MQEKSSLTAATKHDLPSLRDEFDALTRGDARDIGHDDIHEFSD